MVVCPPENFICTSYPLEKGIYGISHIKKDKYTIIWPLITTQTISSMVLTKILQLKFTILSAHVRFLDRKRNQRANFT